ncbi:NAD(P)-dependent oxidoreductase [Listeria sp. FSL L7-1509]|uniref:NAD(P)-dependent oxidoreductase n=1 Tax=Listeria immobilis TaxID=2713502 RepID=A0ABR6SXL6_9LIST|nr:NAD(P)-dependent oxidoreductase [Listeria immobilis]MBC1483595.1 NAD(P)-dependent oxidoreductase [Listeria immobilis]MBC1507489.1 NAD(P)-dependent oxidoreductase [Listeria immobilis]MBC1510354.1 NAD(P)-dependent oxidoreductase [Listeria immobilis]MBC6304300.1 NAD(P)-dependent oxidoreductase [Listeria immobilis]MBC6313728.1 NAD(P)-dependent oxidoreductase [Listeria immobilis]
MKIAIIGATGKAGNEITKEALRRGHDVTGFVRNKAKLSTEIKAVEKDIFALTTSDLENFDAVVDAFNAAPGEENLHQTSLKHLSTILKGTKTRLIIVGGAGSLYVDPEETIRVMDTPDFPAAFLPTATNMGAAFDALQKETNLNWTYISPAAFFNPDGARTEEYKTAQNVLTTNAAGNSEISYADYAIAFVDEIEMAQHLNQRFSVVSK